MALKRAADFHGELMFFIDFDFCLGCTFCIFHFGLFILFSVGKMGGVARNHTCYFVILGQASRNLPRRARKRWESMLASMQAWRWPYMGVNHTINVKEVLSIACVKDVDMLRCEILSTLAGHEILLETANTKS